MLTGRISLFRNKETITKSFIHRYVRIGIEAKERTMVAIDEKGSLDT
ncbi:MAG: hypothetical protein QXP66_02885 [Candidatus Aenigmatarchaeota archaeon]